MARAKKMRRARLEHQFEIPLLARPESTSTKSRYHIGCSGWFYWNWRGIFYPQDMPSNQWFRHYMSEFETVELNAPFYSWPTIGTVKSWVRQAAERPFVYTVKVCELITHIKKFRGTKELVRDFGFIADILGPRMGCFLFQLPPSYTYTPARLKNILSQLQHNRKNVVEFRHESWWNAKVYAAFRKTGTIFCSCSGPKLPDELIKTSDDIYIRFHGTEKWYRHDYSKEEIATWVRRIKDSEAKQIWVYFNNDYEGHAIRNAHELIRQIKRKDKRKSDGSIMHE